MNHLENLHVVSIKYRREVGTLIQCVDNLKKGLNVIRMKDGTIRKAVVK